MIVFELLHIIFLIVFASLNALWIKEGKRIKHFWNGLLHLVIAIAGWFTWGWTAFFVLLCNTNVVFNVSLNLFRGLGIDYVSPSPKSIIDKIEKKLFGSNGLLPKLIYIFISVVLNFIYLKFYH